MTYLAVDELDVTRALRIAVTSTVLGTGLVAGELGHSTIRVHLTEVQSTVETAGELGHVNVESELLVQELEHVVLGLAVQEVDTRADVGARHELKSERVAGGGDTVGALVVGTVKCAVRGTSHTVGAEGGVPRVTGVAVGVAGDIVQPTPVGVEDNGGLLGNTASCGGTLLRSELRVSLRCLGASLLAIHHSSEREGEES